MRHLAAFRKASCLIAMAFWAPGKRFLMRKFSCGSSRSGNAPHLNVLNFYKGALLLGGGAPFRRFGKFPGEGPKGISQTQIV